MEVAVKIRWTPRRIRVTAAYSLVGFLIAMLFSPVLLVFLLPTIHSMAWMVVCVPLACMIGYTVVGISARGTCRKSPAGPAGIAAGLIIGSIVIAFFASNAGTNIYMTLALPLFGLAQALGGYRGALRGLRENLGGPVPGVGSICAHCGYDLSATAGGWKCPECGGELRYASREAEV
ncbi:hypothetical protein PHYC_02305 [Phycisphaerales bacterium]|nr:hypothetical protein PHYC_02305 [Phycisphaerales bacterium]